MKKTLLINFAIGTMMVSSAAVTQVVTPRVKMADTQARFELATMIPERFGSWHVDETVVPLQVDAETQAQLNKIYNQTLSRTYINRDGERIMLSIAYGGDQSDNMGVHKPEICYGAQGFDVKKNGTAQLDTSYGKLPVTHLFAKAGARQEPITYWITIGGKATLPGVDQRLAQLRYGLTGMVADGMLVRVSNIAGDASASYVLQNAFINDLLQSLDPASRARLIGTFDT